jgi:hypothetical protein
MNQAVFATRNIADKVGKVIGNWATFKFYWQSYVLSRFDTVEPDVYIVSYPKCGRTWLRVILQRYVELRGEGMQCFNDKSLVDISGEQIVRFEHDQGNWVPSPLRVDQLAYRTAKYQDKKVLFMVRDPRDVLVSSWYHLKFRENIYLRDLSSFIRDDLVGIHKIIAFTNMWIENCQVPSSFFLLSYEQMHIDPVGALRQVLEFIGTSVEPEALQTAIEASSFDNMKRMELKGSLKEPWMKPGTKGLLKSLKVRRGRVGGFREELSAEDIAFLDAAIRSELSAELSRYH